MIRVHIEVEARFRPILVDALGANPAGVFLFANNKMRDNPYQTELVGVVAFVQQARKFRETKSKNNRFLDKSCLNSRPSGMACTRFG